MSSSARQSTTVGEIVNLMSVDTQKIQDACNEIHVRLNKIRCILVIIITYILHIII